MREGYVGLPQRQTMNPEQFIRKYKNDKNDGIRTKKYHLSMALAHLRLAEDEINGISSPKTSAKIQSAIDNIKYAVEKQ